MRADGSALTVGSAFITGGGAADFARYQRDAVASVLEGWQMPEEAARRLVDVYGTQHVRVLAYAAGEPDLLRPLSPGCPLLAAEAVYAARWEMAATLEDFLRRRSDLMLFAEDGGESLADEAARLMARALGWSRDETRRQVASYREAVARMTAFRPRAEASAAEAAV